MTSSKTQVNVRLSESLATKLRGMSDIEGVNLSDLAEEAFSNLIERRKQDPGWQERYKAWEEKQKAIMKALR